MREERNDVAEARVHYGSAAEVRRYSADRALFAKERLAFESIPENSKILDLGCGAGRTTFFLKEKSQALVALDIAFAMVRAAREVLPGVPCLVGDASCLCFRDGAFDVVVFSFNGLDYIHPLDRRRAALEEVRRVLRPGGLFIFSAHNHSIPRGRDGVVPFLASLLRRNRSGYIVEKRTAGVKTMTYLTTPTTQVRELEELGFELLEVIPRNILRNVKSLRLIGLVDAWIYYVCRSSNPPSSPLAKGGKRGAA